MDSKELINALDYLEREKGINRDILIKSIERGLLSVYQKRSNLKNLNLHLDPKTGEIAFFDQEGREIPAYTFPLDRMAATAAKQVIIQQLREAEREATYQEFKGKEGEIINAMVERYETRGLLVNIGRTEGIFLKAHLLPKEYYRRGDRIQGYILEIRKSFKGPQVMLSRTHPDFIKSLFKEEISEIKEGIIKVEAIARYPGECSKIAVSSQDPKIDPVGTCIGIKGSRIKTILKELRGERVDVIRWNEKPELFIANALSPAKCKEIKIKLDRKESWVILDDDQLSLAIGKRGQNVKLAAKLTGFQINIKSRSASKEESLPAIVILPGIGEKIVQSLVKAGISSIKELAEIQISTLLKIKGIGKKKAEKIIKIAKEAMDKEK